MDALLVDGDKIELTPDPPWTWVVPVIVSVTAGMGHKVTADGKLTIWPDEIMQAGELVAMKQYMIPGFAPGAVTKCTLIVNTGTLSKVYKDGGVPLATAATTGTFTAVMVPATNPAGAPDPAPLKTGTWKVLVKQQSVAKSNNPSADSTQGDDANSKAANAAGANSDPDSVHRQFYYDDVQLEEKSNVSVNAVIYDLVFEDNPHRNPKSQPVKRWNAELSWVGLLVDEKKYRRLITLSWGFAIPEKHGPVVLVQPRVVSNPTEFHLNAVSQAFRIVK